MDKIVSYKKACILKLPKSYCVRHQLGAEKDNVLVGGWLVEVSLVDVSLVDVSLVDVSS